MASVKSTVASQATVTVNAAFFQEIKEVNQELYDLLERLRRALLAAGTEGSARQERSAEWDLVEAFGELRDQLALHFALEEAYGYFEDPVYVAPRLCETAAGLREDHKRLYLQVSQLADDVERLARRGRLNAVGPRIRSRFEQFHEQLQAHESRENELILQAYDDDIGVGD